ncbi:cobalamin biosynthesis protein [Deferribacteraceae bacterium V6Fe1]|nr:cobalamin biosynthesis protein [Deferribacteraceae bacterium V6Fe1]
MSLGKRISVIAITEKGARLAEKIVNELTATLYLPDKCKNLVQAKYFDSLQDIFSYCFKNYEGIVAIMAQGIVARMVNGLIKNKYVDPAVVVCDEVGRFAISMLSGHEGGANELTFLVASITGAEPIITTASEANKIYVAGVGCRQGVKKEKILDALNRATEIVNISTNNIRVIASCWHKKGEIGLIEAAKELNCYLRFLPKELYENALYSFKETAAKKYLGIKGVAEPSALLAARNPKLILVKTVFDGVTIAIAKENLLNG